MTASLTGEGSLFTALTDKGQADVVAPPGIASDIALSAPVWCPFRSSGRDRREGSMPDRFAPALLAFFPDIRCPRRRPAHAGVVAVTAGDLGPAGTTPAGSCTAAAAAPHQKPITSTTRTTLT